MQKILGSTLIELMLAMTIGVLLLSLIIEIFIVSKSIFARQIALYQVQDNAKMALSMIEEDITHAGYIACPRLSKDFAVRASPPYSLTIHNKIAGSENEITIIHAEFAKVTLQSIQDQSHLNVSNETHFTKNDILVISDCSHAEIVRITKILSYPNMQKIQLSTPLHYKYDKNTEISRLSSHTYFIAPSHLDENKGKKINALFVKNIKNINEELVPGIDHLQFTYDILVNNKLTTIRSPPINDKLIGVAITIEARSLPINKKWYGYASL